MKITTNYEKISNDLYDVLHLYYKDALLDDSKPFVSHEMTLNNNVLTEYFKIDDGETYESKTDYNFEKCRDELENKRILKRFAKLELYKLLQSHFKVSMPYGSLTGIRPTKVGYELLESGIDKCFLKEELMKKFLVSEDKARLVSNVIQNQKCLIKNDNLVDLYINIPFCPTRCSYCSFISSEIEKVRDIIPQYLDSLIKEIDATKKLIVEKSYILRTIYIGGGNPTVLSSEQLEYLLSNLNFSVSEFTVECGRPDTITKEKLDVLKKYGVTRISINPQTFVDATLKRIGRKHTAKDVINAYKLALPYDFTINMDLIAGLTGETLQGFKRSVDTAIELAPDNLTIHTLSIKNGSILSNSSDSKYNELTSKMVEYATSKLMQNGYKPYYLYRQKNQIGGLENVGYYKEKVCIFNVDSMEESMSILACGANAISKRVFNIENRIERFANVKFANEYIQRIDEMIEKKKNLFLK